MVYAYLKILFIYNANKSFLKGLKIRDETQLMNSIHNHINTQWNKMAIDFYEN